MQGVTMYRIIYSTFKTSEIEEFEYLDECEEFLKSIAKELTKFEIQNIQFYCACDELVLFDEEKTKEIIHSAILGD